MHRDKNPHNANELRRQAEQRVIAKTAKEEPNLSEVEKQRLVHELQVHQIEL
jgi:hypothetical protein